MTEPSAGSSVSRSVSRGLAWVGTASALVAVCDLVGLALILRFWTSKAGYGTATLVTTLFGALQLVGEAGLPAALVQRDHADPARLSTAFWLGLMFGAGLYGVIWLVAPLIGQVFDTPLLTDLFRVAGLTIVLRSVYTTPQALLRKQLRFKELSLVRMLANLAELATKVGSAAAGAGLWCFVLGPIAREVVYAVGVPLASGWRPSLVFRPRGMADDFRFGVRSTGGDLVYQLYSNFDYQVVGYFFGREAVGVYRAAYELVLEPVKFVSGVVTVVAFPAFARLRSDRTSLVAQMLAFTRQNLAAVLMFVALIVVTADDMLHVVFGPEFVIGATAARVLAIVGALRALSFLGPPLLDGVGRSDLSLRYQLVAAMALTTSFVIGARLGTSADAVAVAWAVGYPLAFVLLARMVLHELGLTATAFVRPLLRLVAIPVVAAGCGLLARLIATGTSHGVRLAISGGVVLLVSIAGLVAFEGYSPRAIARRIRG